MQCTVWLCVCVCVCAHELHQSLVLIVFLNFLNLVGEKGDYGNTTMLKLFLETWLYACFLLSLRKRTGQMLFAECGQIAFPQMTAARRDVIAKVCIN